MTLDHSPRALFPQAGLSGAKVRLCRFGEADITAEYLSWLQDPDVVRFSNQRFRRHDEQSSRNYLASFADSGDLFLSVRNLENGHAIGTMTAFVSMPHKTADMGILIGDRGVWARGMGRDAWTLLLEWLLQHARIRKVTAGCAAGNVGMVRLMEHAGMHHEATLRQQEIIDGRPHDLVYYARFRDV
jgi:RimJ/RimL family protein N-acetyltransferase